MKNRNSKNQICMVQLDPFGYCDSSCWFCPVAYEENPAIGRCHMSKELLLSIVSQLHENMGGIVSNGFVGFYTAHYNEVLLYKHFEYMLEVFAKYNFGVMILTNGISLIPEKIDIIKRYKRTVHGLNINLPAGSREAFIKYTGKDKFEVITQNIDYLVKVLPEWAECKHFSIQVNGLDRTSDINTGGWLKILDNAPDIDLDTELDNQVKDLRNLFPRVSVYKNPALLDRIGILEDHKVMSNMPAIRLYDRKYEDDLKVVGCKNGAEIGGRPFGWIHINANGDTFICCNDYRFDHVYGSLKDQKLIDIWLSPRHMEETERAFGEICRRCASAIYEERALILTTNNTEVKHNE